MNVDQIHSLGPQLAVYLDQFADCFGRSEPRSLLADYVRGQLSDLPRKSVEPIALAAGVAPRTLQEFLRTDVWDHPMLRDRVQQIVARQHRDPNAIGILDDSGHPKKGTETACVARQYCGNTGKVDNCVVSVHLTYASYDTRFRTMIDSVPYLPACWDTPEQRKKVGLPDDVVYRPKYEIGLEELDRARLNGLVFAWLGADAWYGEKPRFLLGLVDRQQRFVVEIPYNLPCWSFDPGPDPQVPPKSADRLCRHSRHMLRQPWVRFQIKTTEKGPLVWEVKAMPVWWRGEGRVLGPLWLVWARNVLDPKEEKFWLSDAPPGTPLEVILHVGFARWPIERCLEDEKTELGLSHFEVRNYQALCRHLLLTQVSHLFLAEQTSRLRGEKSGDHDLSGSGRGQRPDRCPAAAAPSTPPTARRRRPQAAILPTTQRRRPTQPHQETKRSLERTRN